MMRYGYGGYSMTRPGFYGLDIVFFLIFVGVVIFLLFILFKNSGRHYEEDNGKALDILKERYARGEIGKKEFEEMRKDIR